MPIRNLLIILILLAFVQGRTENRIVRLPGSIVETVSADSVGSRVVWDFSRHSILGQCALQYVFQGDSAVMELLPEFRSDYSISGDSICLAAMEGRTWRCLTDTLSMLPHYNGPASGSLSINLSRKFDIKGNAGESVSYGHTVITAPGDTVTDVRLLTLSFSGELTEATADSLVRTHASGHVEAERRYWIAGGAAYPLATDWRLVLPDGTTDSRIYVFPSAVQASEADLANAPKSPAARASADRQIKKQPDYGIEKNKHGGPRFEEIRPKINATDNTVIITLGAGSASADILLCDIAGRVIEARRGVELQTIFAGLVPGEYLVSILMGETRTTEKIIIR